MSRRRPPRVVLVSAPGTLARIDPFLQRAGVRLARVTLVQARPVASKVWLGRVLRNEKPDTLVFTSRAAVEAGLEPWLRAAGPLPPSLELWAVGPGTALALRRGGGLRIRRPTSVGSLAMVAALRRREPRTVVHLRSDLAGPRLARALRKQGHRVLDVIVYRVAGPAHLGFQDRRVLSKADLLVATSPSALRNLRRSVDPQLFVRLTRTVPLVVLGPRTLRSARGHRFRRITIAPSIGPQRFTRHLLGVLDLAER